MLDVDTRGLVNQLTYAVNLHDPITDSDVESVASNVLAQRMYQEPVPKYYAAAEAALQDAEPLADDGAADRRAHDFLRRLVRTLDERRPWAEARYEKLDPGRWATLMTAPLLGQIELTPTAVRDRVSRGFTGLPDGRRGLILRLQTGQVVGLLASASPGPGVEVRSADDPAQTLADLRELTGLEVRTT